MWHSALGQVPRPNAYPFGQVPASGRRSPFGAVSKWHCRGECHGWPHAASRRSRRICVEAPVDGIPPQDRDGAASARPYLSSCPQERPAPARRKQVREPLLAPHQYRDLAGSRAGRAGGVLDARAVGGRRRRQCRRGAQERSRADGRPRCRGRAARARGARREPPAAGRSAPAAAVPRRRDRALARPALAARLGPARRRVAARRRRLRRQRRARRRGRGRGRARRARARRVRRDRRPAAALGRLRVRAARPQRHRRAALGPGRRARRGHGEERAAAGRPADRRAPAPQAHAGLAICRRSTSSSSSRTSSSGHPSRRRRSSPRCP